MKSISFNRLQSILDNLPRLTIGLVGDLFLDRYLELAANRHETSLETGLEAYQIDRVRNAPGALGTVMNNLAALGVGRLMPVTVLGDDGHAFDLCKPLEAMPVDSRWLLRDPARLTPTYTKPLRLVAPGQWEELNRLDVRTLGPLSDATTQRVCDALREVWCACDGLMVMDQINEPNWGVVNDAVRQTLEQLSRETPQKLLYVDSRRHLRCFGFGTLKGNRAELLAAAAAIENAAPANDANAAGLLAARTGRTVFCTLGEEGILVTHPDQSSQRVEGCPVSGPIDIVGAGDAASSGIVVSLLSGASDIEAASVANIVASITVQQLGTTGTATPQQVLDRWQSLSAGDN